MDYYNAFYDKKYVSLAPSQTKNVLGLFHAFYDKKYTSLAPAHI